jgi:hypothetical protein
MPSGRETLSYTNKYLEYYTGTPTTIIHLRFTRLVNLKPALKYHQEETVSYINKFLQYYAGTLARKLSHLYDSFVT